MAINSTSGVNSAQQSPFPSVNVGVAKSALSDLINARIDISKRPIAVNDLASLNGLNVQRAQLAADASTLNADKVKFESVFDVLTATATSLDELVTLGGTAGGAAPGDLPGIQAAAESLISALRSSLDNFNTRFPELSFVSTVPADSHPALAVVENTFIESVSREIPIGGTTVTVDIEHPATPGFPNGEASGRRARFPGLRFTGGGGTSFVGSNSFNIAGDRGLVFFNFAPGTTKADVITAINERTSDTGVFAEEHPTAVGYVNLLSEEYGPDHFATLTQFTDTTGLEVLNDTSFGRNAVATITVNGQSETIEADGRIFDFDVGGIQGVFRLYDNGPGNDGLGAVLDRVPVSFNVLAGGTRIATDSSDETLIGFSGLRSDFLGLKYGGLDRVDFVNDLYNSVKIVEQARDDINRSLNSSSLLSDAAGTRVQANVDQITSIDESISLAEDTISGLQTFAHLDAEARFQSAQSVFAQVSSLFPVSAARLL